MSAAPPGTAVLPGTTATFTTAQAILYFQPYPGKHTNGISGLRYQLYVNGVATGPAGTTGANGEVRLNGLAPTGNNQLEILGTRYQIRFISTIEPLTGANANKGLQRRLAMLGYELGNIDGDLGRKTDREILNFQGDKARDTNGFVSGYPASARTQVNSDLQADAGI
ncbi:MAG: hypothetical protein JNN12_01955 [Bacteroidetes Order II. Incertae sedis bacterium]|nr:hypothetical protein [Bacteroidetes Order II. bacterium]